MRKTTTIGLIVAGVVLMVVGFFAAAPWGTDKVSDADPVFTGAPILFVLGITCVILATVLYELLPDRNE